MIKYLRTKENDLEELQGIESGTWIRMVNPNLIECREVAEKLNIDYEDIIAALDEEESARVDLQDEYTLIIVDIPTVEVEYTSKMYTTIPLGIIVAPEAIVTICTVDTPVLQSFMNNQIREFSTKKKMRFVYQILNSVAVCYQEDLRNIDKRRMEIEERIGHKTKEKDLINLHKLESMLVYFATSLRANDVVLDRLTRYKRLEQYPEDKELLDDVIIEVKQAIEMTSIYRDVISGTRDLMSTVINNQLNNVMKNLASITVVMAIPTIISGLYGMNINEVGMPLARSPYGFALICGLTGVLSSIILLILKKKNML